MRVLLHGRRPFRSLRWSSYGGMSRPPWTPRKILERLVMPLPISFVLEIGKLNVEGVHRELNLPQAHAERKHHQDEAAGEEHLSRLLPPGEQNEHTHNAQQETCDSELLHRPNEKHAAAELANLLQYSLILFLAISLV